MKTICKYPLVLTETQELCLPLGAEILTVQMWWEECCCLVLHTAETTILKKRKIRIFGTGHPVPETALSYISTVRSQGMVWHIFEELS